MPVSQDGEIGGWQIGWLAPPQLLFRLGFPLKHFDPTCTLLVSQVGNMGKLQMVWS